MNIPTGFKDRLANELSAMAHASPAAPATPTLGRRRRAPLMAAEWRRPRRRSFFLR
ncbi:hypothetical protein [Streptomyces anthocyanicus]|uniref:hypothetical protein n=1 Tax=Streptomyces anthocyanicus TaxID=68174 RepID=UPI00381E05C0